VPSAAFLLASIDFFEEVAKPAPRRIYARTMKEHSAPATWNAGGCASVQTAGNTLTTAARDQHCACATRPWLRVHSGAQSIHLCSGDAGHD
jgi:methylmalonyl-CoA mutase N-terminal domain/subunit